MTNDIQMGVAGTAFVVNYSRTKMLEVSKDIYAHLWVNTESIEVWERFAAKVYANDDANLCARSRFFLERLNDFIAEHEDPVFVDIASGFDNYPFLVDGNCRFLEFDCRGTMDFKRSMVQRWMEEGRLPRREVEYLPTDLNSASQRKIMHRDLRRRIEGMPSMIALQGITYYLQRDALDDILRILADVQKRGSMVLFDYWRQDAMEYPTMPRLKRFLEEDLGCAEQNWNLFDESYIHALNEYEEIESTDIAELERRYSKTRKLQQRENKIPGCYSVLRRR